MSIPSALESAPAGSSQPASPDWQPCQLQAHLIDVRSRQSAACDLVSEIAEPVIRRTLELYCEGLHEDDVLVGLLSPQEGT